MTMSSDINVWYCERDYVLLGMATLDAIASYLYTAISFLLKSNTLNLVHSSIKVELTYCSEISFELHRILKTLITWLFALSCSCSHLHPSPFFFFFGQGPLRDYSQVVARTWTPSMRTATANSVSPRLPSSCVTGFERPSVVVVGHSVIGWLIWKKELLIGRCNGKQFNLSHSLCRCALGQDTFPTLPRVSVCVCWAVMGGSVRRGLAATLLSVPPRQLRQHMYFAATSVNVEWELFFFSFFFF